jgi:hypothetical protein
MGGRFEGAHMSNTNANLPNPTAPVVMADGRMSPQWFAFFLALFNRTGGPGSPIDINTLQQQDEISQDVPPQNAATIQALRGVEDLWSEQRAPENMSSILARLDALESATQTQPDLSLVMRRLDELEASQSTPISLANLSIGASFGDTVSAPKFQTGIGSAVASSGVATTVYTLPNRPMASAYLVYANLGNVNDASSYGAFAVVLTDGASSRIALSNNSTFQTISVSGLSVQTTQTTTFNQVVRATVTRIG